MKKFFQKSLTLLLALVIVSSSLLQPLPAKAGPVTIDVFCATSDVIAAVLDAFRLDFITQEMLDGPWYNPSICSFQDKVFDAPEDQLFGERYTFAQVNWITSSLLLQTVGRMEFIPVNFLRLFAQDGQPQFRDFASLGPAGLLVGSISEMVSNPPASGIDSVRSTLAKFDPATPAHAQEGYGYTSTGFLRPLWTASRDMAYAIIVVLLIASGFLVMFRVKISPQAAVTLQLMIPRIVITLLMVTFSYAIAGFVIDLVFLFLSIFISLLGTNELSDNVAESIQFFLTPGLGKLFIYYLHFWNTIGWAVLIPLLGPLFGWILALVILFLLFKVFWMMLKTYLTLMFLIIIGPWQIMLGILPGQSGFSSWLRNVIANASVFAVVPIMFIFNMIFWSSGSGIFQTIISALFGTGPIFDLLQIQPHIVGPASGGILPDLPLFGSQGFIFNFALGYAILSLIPKTAEMIKDALKAPAFKYGTAFGEALGPARTIGRGTFGLGRGATDVFQQGYVAQSNLRGTDDLLTKAFRAGQTVGIFSKKT